MILNNEISRTIHVEKLMAKKMTKSEITQMRQKLQSEIDWDLLEQLDMEEEGQVLPMQDPPQTKASSQDTLPPLGQPICEHPGPVPAMDAPPKDPPSRM